MSSRLRCSAFLALSLDGFLAREDGSVDWLASVERPDEDYGFAAFAAGVDAFVIGRETYETCLGFPTWPYEGRRFFVVTHRPLVAGHGERAIAGSVAELIATLEAQGVTHAYVDGGTLVRQFLAAGRLDELTISTLPILLGRGRALFGPDAERGCTLLSSRVFASGLVQSHYAFGG